MRKVLSILFAFALMLACMVPAFAAADPTVSTKITGSGNNAKLEITVKDANGSGSLTGLAIQNNSITTYDVKVKEVTYIVEVQISGNSVKSAKVAGIRGAEANSGDKLVLKPGPSKRTDSSGDKIPSNAHSADFPGVYFGWDTKQKDPGVFYVKDWVFDMFVDGKFVLTAQNSNRYSDYAITPDALHKIDGGINIAGRAYDYEYRIPKVDAFGGELKNINQVFIGGNYKDASFKIVKNWFDEEGEAITDRAALDAALKFNNGYTQGVNTVKITNYSDAATGKKVSVTESLPAGFLEQSGKTSKSISVKWNDDPIKVVEFNNQKQWSYIIIGKDWDQLDNSTEWKAFFDIHRIGPSVKQTMANFEYKEVGPGKYQVKEGAFLVIERDIEGFTPDTKRTTITVTAGNTATVSFLNVEDRATVNITKVWKDGKRVVCGDNGLVELTNGWTLGSHVVKAGEAVNFTEDPVAEGWELTSITVDGVAVDLEDGVDFAAEKDMVYDIVITNSKINLVEITISKVWVIGNDEVEGNDCLVKLTNGWKLGEVLVRAGTKVNFTEEPICGWELFDISVNEEKVSLSGVDFKAAKGGKYEIVITNWQPGIPTGEIVLKKTVDGISFKTWFEGSEYENISDYINGFELYNAVDGAIVGSAIDFGTFDDDYNITFTKEFTAGYYAVKEILTDEGKKVFKEVAPLFFYFDTVNVIGDSSLTYVSDASVGSVVSVTGSSDKVYALPETWNNELRRVGYGDKLDKLLSMGAEWIWDVEDTYVYGDDGNVAEFELSVTVDKEMTVPFYFAADNAVAVYVNGKLADWSTVAMRELAPKGQEYVDGGPFGDLTDSVFDGGWEGGWAHLYETNITLKAGTNNIIVVAANSKWEATGPNSSYNTTNNPCGVIFGCEIPGSTVVFENELLPVEPPVPPVVEFKPALDPIPSHSHRFNWVSHGVYALAGSSTTVAGNQNGLVTVDGNYIVAFADNFWEYAAKVTVGYGNNPDRFDWEMEFTKDTDYTHVLGDFYTRFLNANQTNYMGYDVLVHEFPSQWPNPDGGKRHAYLASITLKPGVTKADFLAAVGRPVPPSNLSAELDFGSLVWDIATDTADVIEEATDNETIEAEFATIEVDAVVIEVVADGEEE